METAAVPNPSRTPWVEDWIADQRATRTAGGRRLPCMHLAPIARATQRQGVELSVAADPTGLGNTRLECRAVEDGVIRRFAFTLAPWVRFYRAPGALVCYACESTLTVEPSDSPSGRA